MKLTREQIQLHAFALRKARHILTPGDWLTVRRCGDTTVRFKFTGFAGQWLCKSGDIAFDHPVNILKINGSPIDMRAEAAALLSRWWEDFADQFARENGFPPSPRDGLHERDFDWFCRGRDLAIAAGSFLPAS